MKEEIWKDIKGYEGLYQVSSFGRIKSFKRYRDGKILRPGKYSNGYMFVKLSLLNTPRNTYTKSYSIHRLVAEHFIPNHNSYPIVNHKDNNKENNDVDNLEWCTHSYNSKYAIDIGIVKNQCKICRRVYVKKGNEQLEFDTMESCCNYFGFAKCWLGNYSRKHGNPCEYNDYMITIESRGDADGVR